MAETVAALYTKLGLDLSDLDSQFSLADKTVRQAMGRINHENKKIKLQTDIDLAGLDSAKDRLKRVEVEEAALTKQLELQREKIKLTEVAYREMTAAKGADSAASAKLETRLLSERKAYANLQAQMKATQKERAASTVTGRAVSSIINGASATSVITQGLEDVGVLSLLKSPVGKAVGVGAAVTTGLVAMAKSAMNTGLRVKELAEQMHTTNAEAAQMNMIFKLAGADVGAAVAPIIRLDKAVEQAGDAGNSTTRILAAFGVNLRNSSGALLPVTQQLQELAKGYENAEQAGLANEYVAQVLGARGRELVPVLKDMTELQQQASSIPTTGLLNPDEAKKMSREWNEMKIAIGQITSSIGAAFMPVVAEALPGINDGIETFVKAIQDNKEDIKEFIGLIGDTLGLISDMAGTIKDVLGAIGIDADTVKEALEFLRGELHDIRNTLKDIKETLGDTALAHGIQALIDKAKEAAKEARAAGILSPEKPEEKKPEPPKEEKKPTQNPDATRAAYAAAMKQREEQSKANAEQKRLLAEQESIQEEIYKNTHNDLQNELHDIDLKAKKYREAGVSEVDIVSATEAAKAKVMQDFNDNTMAQIQKSWQSSLQSRLSDIEREKRAWIQKGVDEVTATRWAEREKSKARQSEALSALKENRDYLNIVRNAMQGGGTQADILARARTGVLNAMREKYGVKDEYMTPQELSLFSQVMSDAKNNLVPGLETDSWARQYTANLRPVDVIRGTESTPAANVTINISGGLWTDDVSMKKCADRVADEVNGVIKGLDRRTDVSY